MTLAEVGTAPIVTREIDARPPLVHFSLGRYDLLLAPSGDGKRIVGF
jgi:hypothetical protein